MSKANDLRERTLEELKELQKTLPRELFTARFKNFSNQLDDTSSLGKLRKEIARVNTVLRQKELALEPVKNATSAE